VHVPFAHVCPAPHARPHAPQWAVSVVVFAHCEPQNVWPVGHVQAPAAHERPPVHAVPHAPQLFGSVWRSTHAAPQKS
jgi:hypothetical protein